MKTPFACRLAAALLAVIATCAMAEKADRDKPMNIEADALRHDDLKQVSIFTGNVVLTKGTILIRGAKVEVRQDPQGYQFGLVTAESGKRAFYRQKREGLDEFIEGEGEVIDYDGRADVVKFITNAQLRRYRGVVLNDDFNGGLIVYNNLTEVFTLDGAPVVGSPGIAGQPGAPAGRVRAMLTPKPDEAAPNATKPPASQLKATPQMGGASR